MLQTIRAANQLSACLVVTVVMLSYHIDV